MFRLNLRITNICIIIVFLSLIFLLSSCQTGLKAQKDYFETDYFMCTKGSMGFVTIAGLTEKGRELEEIAFPTEINGIKVHFLGYEYGLTNYMESYNLKKIYISFGMSLSRADLFLSCYELEKVIFLSYNPPFKRPKDNSLGDVKIYAPADSLQKYNYLDYTSIIAANTSYMYNYYNAENGGYYWVDDINEGEMIKTIPTDPVREGYVFGGWYTETECTNQWDFETLKGENDIILYAKWDIA